MAIGTVKLTKMGNADAERNYTNKVLQDIATNVNSVLTQAFPGMYDNGLASTTFNLDWNKNGVNQLIRAPGSGSSVVDITNPKAAGWLTLMIFGPSSGAAAMSLPGSGASSVTPNNNQTAIVRRFWDGTHYYNIVDGTTF